MKSAALIDWTVQTSVQFPWRRIDFEFESRPFRYIQQSKKLASILRTCSTSTQDDEDRAFQSMSRVLSGLCWTLELPIFSDLHGGCGCSYSDIKEYIKIRKPTVCSKARFMRNHLCSVFSLPVVLNDKAWKALAYYREAFSANSAFHKTNSFFKVIEVAFPEKKKRKKWIFDNFDQAARNEQKHLLNLNNSKSPKEYFSEDVGHHAVAHQYWIPDKLADFTLGHIANRIFQNLANQVIRDILGVKNRDIIHAKY